MLEAIGLQALGLVLDERVVSGIAHLDGPGRRREVARLKRNRRRDQRVATKLAASWAGSGTTVHYIKEYYDSWTAADGAWPSLGIPKTVDEGIHDDYSVNSIIATVDPEKIRFKQRQETGKASINGQTLLPLETTIANGRKLVEIRANITVEAIRKLLPAK